MKRKLFESSFTNTALIIKMYGDEGISINIYEKGNSITHVFNNEDEVKQLIKQLKDSLSNG